jgi:K+-transporting ATPase ATPase A chain
MNAAASTLIAGFLVLVLLCVKPVGLYMANVFDAHSVWPRRAGAPLERWIYRLCGIDPSVEMGWKQYAFALLMFNALGALAVYALQRTQLWLPLNFPICLRIPPSTPQ